MPKTTSLANRAHRLTATRTSIAVALAASLAMPFAATAHTFKSGDITVTHPWTKVTPGGAKVGAGYLKITNRGKQADALIGGTFPGAKDVEIHEMKMDGNIMKMRRLSDGLTVPPGATVELKPGGNHLMFMGLDKPIVEGADIKATLTFKKAGAIAVEYRVEPMGALKSSDKKMDMEHHH